MSTFLMCWTLAENGRAFWPPCVVAWSIFLTYGTPINVLERYLVVVHTRCVIRQWLEVLENFQW